MSAISRGEPVEPDPVSTAGTLLIVDGNFIVLEDVSDLLRGLGFVTVEASTTDEALSYVFCRSDISGLVVRDDARGCLSSRELAVWVQDRFPHIPAFVYNFPIIPTGVEDGDSFISAPNSLVVLRKELLGSSLGQGEERPATAHRVVDRGGSGGI